MNLSISHIAAYVMAINTHCSLSQADPQLVRAIIFFICVALVGLHSIFFFICFPLEFLSCARTVDAVMCLHTWRSPAMCEKEHYGFHLIHHPLLGFEFRTSNTARYKKIDTLDHSAMVPASCILLFTSQFTIFCYLHHNL